MRLTDVVCSYHFVRLFPKIWKRQNVKVIKDLGIPPELLDNNCKVFKSEDLYKRDEKGDRVISEEPVILDQSFELSVAEKYYLFHNETRLTDDEAQALNLTKTLPHKGFPPMLSALIGQEKLPDQDQLVKACISRSLILDAWQEKLPRKVDPEKPEWIFKREYGVPKKRKVSNLLSKLVILGEMASGKYADSLSRTKILNGCSELFINHESGPVIFQLISDILITSEKPLKCFASPTEVESTKAQVLPSVYPIKPTLDLDQLETCPIKETEVGLTRLPDDTYVHTIHIPHKEIDFWIPVQKLARAIASCFCFTAEQARRKYGDDVKELPEPISIQCIYVDIQSFGFLAYQLNTLDLSHQGGVKNQVWIDEPQNLYETIENEEIINYNPEVFSKMLSFSLNGLHPISL